ncbi:MAG: flagellar hook-basal body complex protein FliE [Thermogemmata sp.]|uniref:Flagellar hook-basal body complex protein FliE n=1 Tax=Thermogemmata fonticola TaxID=2755323 RepID=A0A7V9AAB8_9BACT|nr:flagellar hook-basal body complex protein FliE [Thermogemmata fonticola]MBA2224843.1 flagellar hook-basal body complex protein FliE [Thermogemmata fonticola]MCX8138871.1 flagellar hook-basal body complex protein FliE [Gemmataceae bacterium]
MAIPGLTPLGRLSPLVPVEGAEVRAGAVPGAGSGFGLLLQGVLGQHQKAHQAADAAVRDLATGQAQDLHTVALAVAQADLSFRLILELRNRLSEAYQEVMRMQV